MKAKYVKIARSSLPFVAALLCCVLIFFLGKNTSDAGMKEALESCIQEVSSKCMGLYEYATALEAENARLNKALNVCVANEKH